MVLCERFDEIGQDELQQTEGGHCYPEIIRRIGAYIVNKINYNIDVSYINGYNDTVTSNGRTDLVKPYPEEPQF